MILQSVLKCGKAVFFGGGQIRRDGIPFQSTSVPVCVPIPALSSMGPADECQQGRRGRALCQFAGVTFCRPYFCVELGCVVPLYFLLHGYMLQSVIGHRYLF